MEYKKPQSPLSQDNNYLYPLTTADQIIMGEDNSRLNVFLEGINSEISDIDKKSMSLYKATLLYSDFAVGDAGYNQQVTPEVVIGFPITSSIQLAPPMMIPTGFQTTDEALADTLTIINSGYTETMDDGTVVVTVWEIPQTDIEVYWYGR